jgi:hypothetical protein
MEVKINRSVQDKLASVNFEFKGTLVQLDGDNTCKVTKVIFDEYRSVNTNLNAQNL